MCYYNPQYMKGSKKKQIIINKQGFWTLCKISSNSDSCSIYIAQPQEISENVWTSFPNFWQMRLPYLFRRLRSRGCSTGVAELAETRGCPQRTFPTGGSRTPYCNHPQFSANLRCQKKLAGWHPVDSKRLEDWTIHLRLTDWTIICTRGLWDSSCQESGLNDN